MHFQRQKDWQIRLANAIRYVRTTIGMYRNDISLKCEKKNFLSYDTRSVCKGLHLTSLSPKRFISVALPPSHSIAAVSVACDESNS